MAADLSLFWSYSHSDDGADRGRITLLATHLADEIRVLSGLELDLFVDRSSLEWGDEWRLKIDGSLSASTFMVPVLSPTYFSRPECRREFIDFYAEAESRSLNKLLLPLSYSSVTDFNSDNPDEVIAIASRYQNEDWTSLRLKDPDSEEYRARVNSLALRLLSLHRSMTERERQNLELLDADSDTPEIGFYEALQNIEARLPEWVNAVETDIVRTAQHRATIKVYSERLHSAPPARRLAIRHRYATDDLQIMTVGEELARNYSALSIEMAPYIATVLRGASDSPAALEGLRPLHDAVREATAQILRKRPNHSIGAREYWGPWEHLGGVFKTLMSTHERSAAFRIEANALVLNWNSELAKLFGEHEGEVAAGGPPLL